MCTNYIFFKKIFSNSYLYICLLLVFCLQFRYYCEYSTFKKINTNFKQIEKWEKELQIYSVSMPKFYMSEKKKLRCVLLIGGYKDIPHVWNEFEKYLAKDKIDYYAPRTCGNGRSFFQVVDWKDWVITYLEAIYLLQEMYDSVDIIGFSTGCVIALYLTQFKYKCKINNLFLCAPFLISKNVLLIDLFFSQNIFSKMLNIAYKYTLRFHPKSNGKFKGYRDTYNEYYSLNDYCEMFGDIQMETTLLEFVKFRPRDIFADRVVILSANADDIIGDIEEQYKIISKVYSQKPIDIIHIPSYLNSDTLVEMSENNVRPIKSGHLMFKEKPEIIEDLYANIKKYLIK